MGQEEILELFFENPTKEYHIRGIAKELNISKTATSHHINKLLQERLIIKQTKDVFPSFKANATGELYKLYKLQAALRNIAKSNLANYVEKEVNPKCIILFGSFAKAEYDINSDIDLFVQAAERYLDIKKYEKKLKHKINFFFEPDIKKLSPQLLNNIVNGIKLGGFLKIK